MSVHSRLNILGMFGVLPFNYGLDYEGWKNLYAVFGSGLCDSDPNTWSASQIEEVNRIAREETEVADRLLALSDEEFDREIKKFIEVGK